MKNFFASSLIHFPSHGGKFLCRKVSHCALHQHWPNHILRPLKRWVLNYTEEKMVTILLTRVC